jgi:hypothetical protein
MIVETACETGIGRVLVVPMTAKKADIYERAVDLLARLEAQLQMTCGNAGESFRALNDDLQDAYLYGCASQIEEARALLRTLAASVYGRPH